MNVLKPDKQSAVELLLKRGVSQHEIHNLTGIDRKTIRSYGRKFGIWSGIFISNSPSVAEVATGIGGEMVEIPPPRPPGQEGSTIQRLTRSACVDHQEWIQEQVALGRNSVAIYQDLVENREFSHRYNSVKRFVRHLKKVEPHRYDRLEFFMGEEAQVDYGQGAMTRMTNGKWRRPRLFVMTLKYSGRSFRKVEWKSSQETWAMLHEEAFRYFGGSPRYVVLDNLKEGVITPDIYDPAINTVYQAMLAHYGVIANPAKVRDPNRKGTVENAIKHTQDTALKGRRFETIDAQNQWLTHWEENWAATRIHGRAKRQVEIMFQEEKPHLLSLPATGFRYFVQGIRTVSDFGEVQVKRSFYAATPAIPGTEVVVRIYESEIEILDQRGISVLRRHPLSCKAGSVIRDPGDAKFNPTRESDRLLAKAERIGPSTRKLCGIWLDRDGRMGLRWIYALTNLLKTVFSKTVEQAVTEALKNGMDSLRCIKNHIELIEHGRKEKSPDDKNCDGKLTRPHELIRPPVEYGTFFEKHAARGGCDGGLVHGLVFLSKSENPGSDPELPMVLSHDWHGIVAALGLGTDPEKQKRDDEMWLVSPFNTRCEASIQVSLSQNTFKDYNTGKTGGPLLFCKMVLELREGRETSMEEASEWIQKNIPA